MYSGFFKIFSMIPSPKNKDFKRPTHQVVQPTVHLAPVIFTSPHSGREYPNDFISASKLGALALRSTEDSFVDQLFSDAPTFGMPILQANFPRAYVDPNREPFELDPSMFSDDLPKYINTSSRRVAAGIGTIAKVVSSGQNIYVGKIKFSDAVKRINLYYRPYHKTLRKLLTETRKAFGGYFLIDCHSMPSIGGENDPDKGKERADFVLGDRFGNACGSDLTMRVAEYITSLGYSVGHNDPFSGGFTTKHYGRPSGRLHTLQIEINRRLYMDEKTIKPLPNLPILKEDINNLLRMLRNIRPKDLASAY